MFACYVCLRVFPAQLLFLDVHQKSGRRRRRQLLQWANCNSFASPVPCCGGRMLHDVVTHFFVVMQNSCHLKPLSGLLLTTMAGVDTKSRNTWKIKLLNDFALVPGVGWFATSWWGLMSSNALLCLTSTWHEIVSVRQLLLWMQKPTKQFRRLEVDGSWRMKKM